MSRATYKAGDFARAPDAGGADKGIRQAAFWLREAEAVEAFYFIDILYLYCRWPFMYTSMVFVPVKHTGQFSLFLTVSFAVPV